MKTKNIIDGLLILQPYYDKQDGYHSGAEHDELYAYATDRPLSDKDVEKMIALGWHQEYDERDYEKDFSLSDYRPEETWVCYT